MMLSLLRTRTRELHERVERAMDLPSRLVSQTAYVALLARLHAFYLPLEALLQAVSGCAEIGLELAPRWKTPLLRKDLAALGRQRPPESAEVGTGGPVLPKIDGLPRALGCLYVLEGATLGGRVIRREVAARLGLAEADGAAFFCGYGERTGAMWSAFCGSLEGWAADHMGDRDAVVDAACETFLRYDAWLAGDAEC